MMNTSTIENETVIEVRYGDIIWTVFPEGIGSVQSGKRPAIVVSNDKNNVCSPVVNVCPITASENKKRNKSYLPTHIPVTLKESGLKKDSVILCEIPIPIDKRQILNKVGHVDSSTLISKIKQGLTIQFNMA